MVSGLSAVNKDVPPYLLCGGRPAVVQGLHIVGLRRAGLPGPVRDELKRAYRLLYRDGLSVGHAVEAIERECQCPEVRALVTFVKAAKRGICAGIGAEGEHGDEESLLPRKPSQGFN